MSELVRGANSAFASSGQVMIDLAWNSTSFDMDVSCFLVREDGKVPDDSYMVFYNQLVGPGGAVSMSVQNERAARFDLHLEGIPGATDRVGKSGPLVNGSTVAWSHLPKRTA